MNRYETFNARYSTFEEVANTFIPNKWYQELLSVSHSILVGPRGCGKTTLLKMLHPQAVLSYSHKQSSPFEDAVPFWGVYIPTDRQWNAQIETVKILFPKNLEVAEHVSRVLVCINVLSSVCSSFYDLVSLSIKYVNQNNIYDEVLTEDDFYNKETELAAELIKLWHIDTPIIPSLYSIIQYLSGLACHLNGLISKKDIDAINNFYLNENFLDRVIIAFTAFSQIFKNANLCSSKQFRWALCFDELEIAPNWLQKQIFTEYLRSTNQSILFKITSTPLVEFNNISEEMSADILPSSGNDYNKIQNWICNDSSITSWSEFCTTLYSRVIQNANITKPLDEYLGDYDIIKPLTINTNDCVETDIEEGEYAPNSKVWFLYRALAQQDESFCRYLQDNDLDTNNPFDEKKLDSVLRKIKTVAVCRYYFLKDEQKRRSRKKNPFYFGIPLVFDITDGNPRLAINLINELSSSNIQTAIPIQKQSEVICKLSDARFEYYNNYPNANVIFQNKKYSLGRLVTVVGDFFQKSLYGPTFNPEPINCFRLDQSAPKPFQDLVKLGLELGAIIQVETKNAPVYKLAYILHPKFNLPKRKNTKAILLTAILKAEDPTIVPIENDSQGLLF